jgi:glycine oxidase
MIVIVGGGICGLSIGWRLAQAGCPVTVFERDLAGRGASWAAAGMLAVNGEAEPGEEKLLPLLKASQALWPDFAAELEAASDRSVNYRRDGALAVALDRDEEERLKFLYDYQRSQGLPVEWLPGSEVRRLEPHLSGRVLAGVFSAEDHQVDNRLAVAALREAFLRAGGVLRENAPVAGIVVENGRATGILTDGERHLADTVVLAAGAWSRNLPGLPEAARPPVRPVKGQMLALDMPADRPLVTHVVVRPDVYLVPRNDGRLLVGATAEEMNFDTRLTAGGLYELLRHAWEVLPGIYDLPVAEAWAGLRPTSRDDAPILGPGPLPGLVYATGHHRNGILLAPITAEVVANYILTGKLAEEARPFTMERFTR